MDGNWKVNVTPLSELLPWPQVSLLNKIPYDHN